MECLLNCEIIFQVVVKSQTYIAKKQSVNVHFFWIILSLKMLLTYLLLSFFTHGEMIDFCSESLAPWLQGVGEEIHSGLCQRHTRLPLSLLQCRRGGGCMPVKIWPQEFMHTEIPRKHRTQIDHASVTSVVSLIPGRGWTGRINQVLEDNTMLF